MYLDFVTEDHTVRLTSQLARKHRLAFTRYSPTTTYLRPNGILAGRFFKFGTQVEF